MRITKMKDKAAMALVALFIIAAMIYIPTLTPRVYGDGNEYMLQTVSFQRHFSFGVTAEDLQIAKEQFYDHAENLENTYNNTTCMHEFHGSRYSNHYGAYSAIATSVKLVLMALNIYPLWAFAVTNFLLWLAALLVLLFVLKADPQKKLCLIALMIFNPVFFYLEWTHTEIYIFAFAVIALAFYYNKQYGRAILFMSVASMQNVAVLPFAMMIGIDYIISRIVEYKEINGKFIFLDFVGKYWIKILPYGFLYLPGLLPLMDTYIKFGTVSHVADVAMESKYLLHKAADYLFDLNLGILPYEPVVLAVFIVMSVIGIRKKPRVAIINLLGIVGMLYVISHQVQINCGMQNIMRYNVWIIPMMIFYVVMNWGRPENSRNFGLISVCIAEVIITSAMICYVWWGGGSYNYNQFAPWTKALMNAAPGLYNPSHGIFYSRALGIETYHSNNPVMYTNPDGYIRKILVSTAARERLDAIPWKIMDLKTNIITDLKEVPYTSIDEGDYSYVNLTGDMVRITPYHLGSEILCFSENGSISDYAWQGISFIEENGIWTDGDNMFMRLLIDEDVPVIEGYMDVLWPFYQPQQVTVLINEQVVYEGVVSGGEDDIKFSFKRPDDGIVNLEMRIPDSIQPSQIDQKYTDDRDLGVFISKMVFTDIREGTGYYNLGKCLNLYEADYNADQYIISGFSGREENGTWTDDNIAEMRFLLDTDIPVISGEIEALGSYYKPQEVAVLINDEEVCRGIIDGESLLKFSFTKPQDNVVKMKLLMPDALKPSEVNPEYTDQRNLGIYVRTVKLYDAGEVNSYNLGQKIWLDFDAYNADPYIISGFSGPEQAGSWTDGERVKMKLLMEGDGKAITGHIDILRAFNNPQRLTVVVNGKKVFSDTVEGEKEIEFSFDRPADDVVDIELLTPDAIRPNEVDPSFTDSRALGFYIRSIRFEAE